MRTPGGKVRARELGVPLPDRDDHTVHALPHDRIVDLLRRYGRLAASS